MLNKKNIAMTMAAATAFTAVAPAVQSFAAVVDTTQEQEIKELKADVLAKFNTKYTENEALKGNKPGQCAYTITMKVDGNVVKDEEGKEITGFSSYAEFEARFDKEFKQLHNGQTIVVNCESKAVRILEDSNETVVEFKDATVKGDTEQELKSSVESGYTNYFVTELGGSVVGTLEDESVYVKVPTSNGFVTLKDGDTKLNLDAPILKVEDGNYVDKDGNVIKKFDAKTAVTDARDVFNKGGVIEGYYQQLDKTKNAAEDKAVYAIVKNADITNKEEVATSDLYEASNDRLTKKGNELRKTLLTTTKKLKDDGSVNYTDKDKLVYSVYGINKVGDKCALNDAKLAEIKVVFEERDNKISEWTPVYEMTIKEVRGTEFDKVIDHVILNQGVANGMNLAAGLDRYKTSIELSKKGWKDNSTRNVVLVSGANDKLVDGLTATPLAAQLDAPVLLTSKDTVSEDLVNEIKRLGAENVYIVGGTSAVSEEVENTLTKVHAKNVTRLAGDSRYETSLVVAEELAKELKKVNKTIDQAFVVGGKGEADALSASAVAGVKKSPILLTKAESLDKSVEGFLKANLTDIESEDGTDYLDIFVVGGESSVSKKVQTELATISGTDFEVKRLAGEGRQETNAAVIENFSELVAIKNVVVGKSNNAALVDSLSAGAYAAKTGSHIVLATDELTESQEDALGEFKKKHNNSVGAKVQAGYGIADKVAKFIKGL